MKLDEIDLEQVSMWRGQADWYQLIFNEITYKRHVPNLFNFTSPSSELKGYIFDELARKEITTWPIDVYGFDNGYVTDLCHVFDSQKNIFPLSCLDSDSPTEFEWYTTISNREVPEIDGVAAFIFKSGKDNYGHMIVEMLPKLLILSKLTNDSIILIIPTLPNKIRIGLELIIQVLYPGKYTFYSMITPIVRVKKLLFPGAVAKHNNRKTTVVTDFADAVNERVKEIYINKPDKIYVSRRSFDKRALINSLEIETFFQGIGFDIVSPENYSFLEQAALFSNAKVVVGPLGAGLTNILYSNNCKVLLFDPGLYDFFFYDLASIKNHEFNWIFEKIQKNKIESLHMKNYFSLKHILPLLKDGQIEI